MGQAKRNQRDCPALGRRITPLECGENRGTRYACPADCPFFPFAPENYGMALEVDDTLVSKMMKRYVREIPLGDPGKFSGSIADPGNPQKHSEFVRAFFLVRDAEGRTFFDRWERAGFEGLSNDERFLLECHRTTRVSVIEVQRLLDEESVEVIDLLDDPARRFTIIDRSLAARAVRFITLLGWVFRTPHYARFHGAALLVPDVAHWQPVDVVREVARHLGAPADDGEPLSRWLAEHFLRVADALQALDAARWEQTLAAMDVRVTKTSYRLCVPAAEFAGLLDHHPDIVRDGAPPEEEQRKGFAESFTWCAPADAAPGLPTGIGRPVLGRVLLGRERVQIDAGSGERQARLRTLFEGLAGERAVFEGELATDVAAQFQERRKMSPSARALVPPRLLESPTELVTHAVQIDPSADPEASPRDLQVRFFRAQYETFLHDRIPSLGDRTPREAVDDPALRPQLVRLMKTHVRTADERSRREGVRYDINWVLEALGLRELISEPPPLGPSATGDEEPWDDLEEDDFDDDAPLAPDPPRQPLSEDETDARLAAVMARPPTEMVERIEDEMPELLAALADPEEELEPHEIAIVAEGLLSAYAVLVPPGTPVSGADDLSLLDRFDAARDELDEALGQRRTDAGIAAMRAFTERSRQPALVTILCGLVAEAKEHGPKEKRPRMEATPAILAMIRAAVDEIDCAVARARG